MPSTPKGYPYPGPTSANNVPGDLQALAAAVNASPGITPLTTTERNDLPASGRWDGRVIYNTDRRRLEVYDATLADWFATVGDRNVQVFNASGTWTRPAGANRFFVEVLSGGGSGKVLGGAGWFAGGGGGGGYASAEFRADQVGPSQIITVGAGGSNAGAGGVTGGTSSFGTLLEVTGGTGGTTGSDYAGPLNAGGRGGGNDGGLGGYGIDTANQRGVAAGGSTFGGGGGGWPMQHLPDGGSSYRGAGGGAAAAGLGGKSTRAGAGGSSTSVNGQFPGGGGAASSTTAAASAGAGASGQVTVTSFYDNYTTRG